MYSLVCIRKTTPLCFHLFTLLVRYVEHCTEPGQPEIAGPARPMGRTGQWAGQGRLTYNPASLGPSADRTRDEAHQLRS